MKFRLDEVYTGTRGPKAQLQVRTRDGALLDPRFDLRRHSPDGFECGYGGSGPAQLALAILCHFLNDDDLAQGWYQAFKAEIIANIPGNFSGSWSLSGREIAESKCVQNLIVKDVMDN